MNFLDVLVGPGGEAGPRRRAKQSHGNTHSLLESTEAAGNDMSKKVPQMDTGNKMSKSVFQMLRSVRGGASLDQSAVPRIRMVIHMRYWNPQKQPGTTCPRVCPRWELDITYPKACS